MNSDTTILMIKALDCLAARAVVTAENIANAGTPGYRPLRLTFEDALKDAAARSTAAVRDVAPKVEQARIGTPEAELRTDLELATANTTSLRYSALIDILSRQIEVESLAIRGNS
jgi:flagellar basal-body rod protein FlgB